MSSGFISDGVKYTSVDAAVRQARKSDPRRAQISISEENQPDQEVV